MTDAFKLGFMQKVAELKKQADPPHRGLNSDNPLLREVYKNIGYVPQERRSYLYSNDADNVNKAYAIEDAWLSKPENLGPDRTNKVSPEVMAASWDLARTMGRTETYHFSPKDDTHVPYVSLGSYPHNNETSTRHEYGHVEDFNRRLKLIGKRDPHAAKTLGNFYNLNSLPFELRAWDLAGVDKNNPVRKAALKTYEMTDEYRRKGTVDGKRIVDPDEVKKIVQDYIQGPFSEEEAKNYAPPAEWIDKYKNKYKDTPVIYDYNSALDAAKNGIEFWEPGI